MSDDIRYKFMIPRLFNDRKGFLEAFGNALEAVERGAQSEGETLNYSTIQIETEDAGPGSFCVKIWGRPQ